MLRLPSLQQQPEDLVKAQPPGFLEVPLRKSRKITSKTFSSTAGVILKPKWWCFYGGELTNMEYVDCEKDNRVPTINSVRFLCRLRRGLGFPATPSRCLRLDICFSIKEKKEKEKKENIYIGYSNCLENNSLMVLGSWCGFLTCLSCSSELTLTLQISQWKVRSWVLGSEDSSPPCSGLGLGPKRGYALIGPSPLRASRMVLCLVPGKNKKKGLIYGGNWGDFTV